MDVDKIRKIKDLHSILIEYEKQSKHWKTKLVRQQKKISEDFERNKKIDQELKAKTKLDYLNEYKKDVIKNMNKYLTPSGKFDVQLIRAYQNCSIVDARTVKKLLEEEFKA